MRVNGESKSSFLLIGLGLGIISGLMAALLARKGTRESIRESSKKTLDYLNQQGKKLREASEGIIEKGKELMSHGCCAADTTEDVRQKERREHLDG